MLEGWLLFESRKRRPNLILRQLNPDKHHRAMRFFIAPWPVPVGAVEALDALEQQAVMCLNSFFVSIVKPGILLVVFWLTGAAVAFVHPCHLLL